MRGCVLVAGERWGKMRSLINQHGQSISEATPSMPVLTTGWKELPEAGKKCIKVGINCSVSKGQRSIGR